MLFLFCNIPLIHKTNPSVTGNMLDEILKRKKMYKYVIQVDLKSEGIICEPFKSKRLTALTAQKM